MFHRCISGVLPSSAEATISLSSEIAILIISLYFTNKNEYET